MEIIIVKPKNVERHLEMIKHLKGLPQPIIIPRGSKIKFIKIEDNGKDNIMWFYQIQR